MVLDVALEQTDLSSRQLAGWITDNKGFSVSESSVYRLLNSQGLMKSPEMKMAAGKDGGLPHRPSQVKLDRLANTDSFRVSK